MLGFLIPAQWLLYGALALSIVIGVPLIVHRYNDGLREEGRAEIRAADKAAAEAQTKRNLELQRAAEMRYTVKAETRERFITKTITEVRHATAALAACPVAPAACLRRQP
jgi:hypothetical protein